MATTNDAQTHKTTAKEQRPWPRRDGLYRFTVEQFYRLDELGFFDDRRAELIEGVIHEMTAKPAHAIASELVLRALVVGFGPGWRIRPGAPFEIGRRTLLEPDYAVVAGQARDSGLTHPNLAVLLIEISETTLRKDRTIKAHHYAKAGIPDYWIVNLVDRQLEVHRNPGPDPSRKGRFRYAEVTIVPESGRIAPLAVPASEIAAADLLP
jgi:Uma2 family endonuclease